jgi:hypothetical protein
MAESPKRDLVVDNLDWHLQYHHAYLEDRVRYYEQKKASSLRLPTDTRWCKDS